MSAAAATSAGARLLDDLDGRLDLVADPAVVEGYRRDEAAPGMLPAGMPLAVARPRTTREVQEAVRCAGRHRVPIVPRGAGSGLAGGANAVDGCLVLCLERMTDVEEVDGASLLATVQPGVLNAALRAAAGQAGLWYAPDPASAEFCTIGGNVATNAGGLCCVKHGVTREALLGLEVVLADGRAVQLGRRTRKGVAGYDLVALMCGSEGTLGIVTRATVRLQPRPRGATTVVATFDGLAGAGRAVGEIVRAVTPSLLEVMDAATVRAVEAFKPMGLDEDIAAMLFARSDAGGAGGEEEARRIADACERAGATLVTISEDEAEGRMLMAARTLAYPALERRGTTLLDDVGVPLGRLAELLDGIPAIAQRRGVEIATFGHAGDGNMHPTIVYDRRDAAAVAHAREAFADVLALARSLGGTITGEHGVGSLKRALVGEELGVSRDVHQAVKRALDPAGLLNPGKAV